MKTPAGIEVRGLRKVYGPGAIILDSLSFDVPQGSFVSIVGPSGCGKSTLLQMLGGLLPASAGSVRVQGTAITAPAPDRISYVFQDALLLPWKTSRENVLFPLEVQKVPVAERERRADHYLQLVGLQQAAQLYPHQLSGGMRQRVSIARGLAQEPGIVLMDEPFGALDEQTRIKMGHELMRIWSATGKTIVLITHSLTEAIFLSDGIIVMAARPGRIVEQIEVGLPRPRAYDVIGSAEFGALRNRLWHLIEADADADVAAAGFAPQL